MLAGALVAAAAIAAVYLLAANSDSQLTFKQGVLLYNASVSPDVATRVGEYLVRQKYFSDEKAVTVQLDREQEVYRLRFVIDPAHADDVLPNIAFGMMGSEIAREVLGGQSIEVALYDDQLQPVKTVPASAKLVFGKGELYFTDPIAIDEAREVGKQLQLNDDFRRRPGIDRALRPRGWDLSAAVRNQSIASSGAGNHRCLQGVERRDCRTGAWRAARRGSPVRQRTSHAETRTRGVESRRIVALPRL